MFSSSIQPYSSPICSSPICFTINSDEDLLFLVEDNGAGIPEDRKNTIFSPCQQPDRTLGGVGVGLYALRKRVEALDGECGVINRFDGKDGVVFWLRFRYIPQVMNDDAL